MIKEEILAELSKNFEITFYDAEYTLLHNFVESEYPEDAPWEAFIFVNAELEKYGLKLTDPYFEHDSISGVIVAI